MALSLFTWCYTCQANRDFVGNTLAADGGSVRVCQDCGSPRVGTRYIRTRHADAEIPTED
ncbi:hypothetical protein GCM10007977_025210 [Dactylosporangium sucinum]|uniref:Uncharacterized protein n=2 Tax=Dactylosporangium sucinum TaxID=1424081 RepID=A0A917TGV0_9ACTN|nr:hypothetical protein GCM10007977_025210 [Dactylosporangium sucinum]